MRKFYNFKLNERKKDFKARKNKEIVVNQKNKTKFD